MLSKFTQGSIADVTQTKITFQAELFDADGVYDTSNSKFTAPSAGKYFFHAAQTMLIFIQQLVIRLIYISIKMALIFLNKAVLISNHQLTLCMELDYQNV